MKGEIRQFKTGHEEIMNEIRTALHEKLKTEIDGISQGVIEKRFSKLKEELKMIQSRVKERDSKLAEAFMCRVHESIYALKEI